MNRKGYNLDESNNNTMETTTSTNETLIHSHYWGNQQGEVAHYRRAQFTPPKLPYSYSALTVLCEADLLKNHFLSVHMKGFEDFLDGINNSKAERMGMLQLFAHCDEFDDKVIVNASIVYNHQLYWDNLSPYGGEASKQLEQAIQYSFGSIFKLKLQLIEMGTYQNCSGWLWLIIDDDHELRLVTTEHHQNTLMKNSPIKGIPILAIDLWEHAYFHKFANHLEDYLRTVWMLINWTEVSNRYRFAY